MMHVLLRMFSRRLVKNPPAPMRVVVLLVAVVAYGTTGFLYFELPAKPELVWADGLWWTLVTMTTIGYGDLFPTTPGGRFLVAVPLMVFGIGLLGYVLSLAAATLVESRNRETRGMKEFRFKDHLVIFNFPGAEKVARIVDELRADPQIGVSDEIILVDDELVELPVELTSRNVHFVRGNPARDETLRRANIDEARRAIVLAKPSDPRSDHHVVAITLAIEARQQRVRTVTECLEAGTEELLRKAGGDAVVCSSRFDAHFISSEVANPGVQEVIAELLSHLTGQQLYFSKIDDSVGSSFGALSKACRAADHIAIGVRRSGKTSLNVAADHALEQGDEVVTIGAKRLELSQPAASRG